MFEGLERRVLFAGDFAWASTFSTGGTDRGAAVAADGSGGSVVAGVYNGSSARIARYTSSGATSWTKTLAGSGEQNIQGIALDNSGNVYAAGYFSGTLDFDPGAGVSKLTAKGQHDGFLLKLSSSGAFLWARQFGGSSDEGATALTVDASGNAFLLGMFSGSGDYDPSPTATRTLASAGSFDVFLVKLDASGNHKWSVRVGGGSEDMANGVSIDPSGNPVVAGTFRGTVDFDPGSATANKSSVGGKDAFVLKLNGATGAYNFARTLGGPGDDQAGDIRADKSGNILTTGSFSGTADFDPSSASSKLTSAGSTDIFVSKLNSAGNFVWARKFGNTGADRGTDLSFDSSGNLYVTGQYKGSVDFDPGSGTSKLSSYGGTTDAFVLKLTSAGNFGWARSIGGSSSIDVGEGIFVNGGAVFVTGVFASNVDLNPGSGVWARTASGASDAFLLKLIAL